MPGLQDILARYFTPRGGMAGFQKWVQQRRARRQNSNPFEGAPGGTMGNPTAGAPDHFISGGPGGTMGNPTPGAPQPDVPFATGTLPVGGGTRGLAGGGGAPAAPGGMPVGTADQPDPMGNIGGGMVGPGSYQPQEGQIGGFQGPAAYGSLQDQTQRRMRQQKAGMGASGGTSGANARTTPNLAAFSGNPFA